MDTSLWILCGAFLAFAVMLIIRLRSMRRAVEKINSEFADKLSAPTNTLIDVSVRDKQICLLAEKINEQLKMLRDERRRFQQGDAELKDAVTNISHDLRTPLTAMSGYLDLLEREEKSETVERYISMISNRTQALKSLTEELFRYSVIVSCGDENCELLNISGVLEESLVSFYGAFEQQHIHPDIAITESRVERFLSRSALSRIFENIILNASKYSDGDFVVTMTDDGTITFSNAAKSLSPVDVGKLFDRFFTLENGKGSTGLGLSIAKLLTERMGGSISAECKNERLYITVSFGNI